MRTTVDDLMLSEYLQTAPRGREEESGKAKNKARV